MGADGLHREEEMVGAGQRHSPMAEIMAEINRRPANLIGVGVGPSVDTVV